MSDTKPACFGIPEECMPRDENGIIQPRDRCRVCTYLRECLKAAIAASGGTERVRAASGGENPPKREEPSGVVRAIRRWSARKSASRRGESR
jgi:hypothetical protein